MFETLGPNVPFNEKDRTNFPESKSPVNKENIINLLKPQCPVSEKNEDYSKEKTIFENSKKPFMAVSPELTKEAFETLIKENKFTLNKEILEKLEKVGKAEFIVGYFDKFENLPEIKSIIFDKSFIDKVKHLNLENKFMEEIFLNFKELELNLDFSFAKFIENDFPSQLFDHLDEFDSETQVKIKKRIVELHYD
jgi:sugar-specific transcriptional regulator TrmB